LVENECSVVMVIYGKVRCGFSSTAIVRNNFEFPLMSCLVLCFRGYQEPWSRYCLITSLLYYWHVTA